jgi:hypothetical protein
MCFPPAGYGWGHQALSDLSQDIYLGLTAACHRVQPAHYINVVSPTNDDF